MSWAGVGTGEEINGQAVVQEAGPEDEAEKKGEESAPGIPHHMMYTKGFNRNGAGVGAGQENDGQVVDSEETPVEQALVQEADTEDEKRG